MALESQAAIDRARSLAESEGVSSGANVEGCRRLVEARDDIDGIVTVIWDTGHRYVSARLFEPDHGIAIPDRDHPLDDHSKDVPAEHQDDWHVVG